MTNLAKYMGNSIASATIKGPAKTARTGGFFDRRPRMPNNDMRWLLSPSKTEMTISPIRIGSTIMIALIWTGNIPSKEVLCDWQDEQYVI